MTIIDILFWISIFSGGLLVLMLLLSIFSGLDLDMDVDLDTGDGDVSPGFGLTKSILTLLSVGSWVTKIMIAKEINVVVALLIGLAAGGIAIVLFVLVFKFFLSQEEEVNWDVADAIGQRAKVYVTVPADGKGIIQVMLGGTKRDLSAVSLDHQSFPTGAEVLIVDRNDDQMVVTNTDS